MTSWKYQLIRTPLQEPLSWLRGVVDARHWSHPELKSILAEDRLMRDVLRQRLSTKSNCIDVGCHYGTMLSRMLDCAPRGRHVAFEPTPAKVDFIRKKFPEVDVRPMAVSDRTGTVEFFENQTATGFSGLKKHGEGTFVDLSVPCTTLDEAVPEDRRFDLIKVDVEGAELFVFRGARSFLTRDQPIIIFECAPTGPILFDYSAGDLHDLLESYGYEVFKLKDFLANGRSVDSADFQRALVYPFQAFNWVASPRRHPRLRAVRPGRPLRVPDGVSQT
jgi:FkbM family methyltransferase